jgi:hypothetical protein
MPWNSIFQEDAMTTTYHAAMMDAETGGNHSYHFEAATDLFRLPARDIVDAFIASLEQYGGRPSPIPYELDSAVVKPEKQVVMATGSLSIGAGGIPFLVMISPAARDVPAQ